MMMYVARRRVIEMPARKEAYYSPDPAGGGGGPLLPIGPRDVHPNVAGQYTVHVRLVISELRL
jgi:hypothetical protein